MYSFSRRSRESDPVGPSAGERSPYKKTSWEVVGRFGLSFTRTRSVRTKSRVQGFTFSSLLFLKRRISLRGEYVFLILCIGLRYT